VTAVLVTGGGGFIGSHLAAELLRRGHHVRVLDNFATGRRENLRALDGAVDLVEDDIRSLEAVQRAVAGCEVVFHQAALTSVPRSVDDPLASNATNTVGTLNVLLLAVRGRDPELISALMAGRRPVVFGDGEQSRDFTYVDNAV
jgi:nucleoside-diphosphate-sugar epimerase